MDHIGLGGDYAGIDITPVDLPDVSAYPKVKPEMLIPLTKEPFWRRQKIEYFSILNAANKIEE